MALELPSYAVTAFDQVGLPWPGIDEDQLSARATSVRGFADDMRTASSATLQFVTDLAESSRSSFAHALAGYCDHHNQLVAALHRQLDSFANALNTAATEVVSSKQLVIAASETLTSQLNAAQASSAPASAAAPKLLSGETDAARQSVAYALSHLESQLSTGLINGAAQRARDDMNSFLSNIDDTSMPAHRKAQSLTLSYESLSAAVQTIQGNAIAVEKGGATSHAAYAHGDLSDHGVTGHVYGDGGDWMSVFHAVEQTLDDVARTLFGTTADAVTKYQRTVAAAIDSFANQIKAADGRDRGAETRLADSPAFKAAERSGEQAAKAYLSDHNAATFLRQLRENQYDPGWQTGAMRALGTTGLQELEEAVPLTLNANGEAVSNPADVQLIAGTVAVAMSNGVTFSPLGNDPGTPGSEPQMVLAPLLAHANFPPKVLVGLGAEAITSIGNDDARYREEIWAALAAHPTAAAQFIQKYATQFIYWASTSDGDVGILPQQDSGLVLNVLKAATTGAKKTDPQGSAAAVTALITAYDKHPDEHAPSAFEAQYGKIIEAYWPDLRVEITNQTGVDNGKLQTPDHVQLSLAQWTMFVDEAMRDPNTAKDLMKMGYDAANRQMQQSAPGNGMTVYAWRAGVIGGYFDTQARTVYQQLAADAKQRDAWKYDVVRYVNDFIDQLPNLKSGLEAAGRDLGKKVADPIVISGLNDIDPTSAPPAWMNSQNYADLRNTYAYKAEIACQDYWNKQPPPAAVIDAQSFTGPRSFVKQTKDGKPQFLDPANMSPEQLTAFNQWLNNPKTFELIYPNANQTQALSYGYAAMTQRERGQGG